MVTYGTAIVGHCKIGQVDDALFQFSLIVDEGLSPNITFFSPLSMVLVPVGYGN